MLIDSLTLSDKTFEIITRVMLPNTTKRHHSTIMLETKSCRISYPNLIVKYDMT